MSSSVTFIIVISDLITLLLSLGIVTFAVGRTFGEVRTDIAEIKKDLGKIEGMFVLRLRDSIDPK